MNTPAPTAGAGCFDDEPLPPPTREEEEGDAWEYWHQRAIKLEAERHELVTALKALVEALEGADIRADQAVRDTSPGTLRPEFIQEQREQDYDMQANMRGYPTYKLEPDRRFLTDAERMAEGERQRHDNRFHRP